MTRHTPASGRRAPRPAPLPTRPFPATGRPLGSIGLGCAGLSQWMYDRPHPDDDSSRALLRAALDHGVTLFDTAGVYGLGHNERLIARALADRSDEVFLATKVGLVVDDLDTLTLHHDGRPAHLRAALDASLRRLRTDTVDLCYLHRVDPDVPLEDSWTALADLVRAGKVRHLGLSEVSAGAAELAHRIHPVAAVQSELSLWARQALDEPPDAPPGGPHGGPRGTSVLGWCADHHAAFVPYAPLGRGFLTGAITPGTSFGPSDLRSRHPRFTPRARRANQRIVTVLRRVADRHGASPAQVALAWTLAQGRHVVPIPSTGSLRHLEDDLGAAALALSPSDLSDLDGAPEATEEAA